MENPPRLAFASQFLGESHGSVTPNSWNQDDELLASITRDEITRSPSEISKDIRHCTEAFVPLRVAERVIELLESINVRQHQGDRSPEA